MRDMTPAPMHLPRLALVLTVFVQACATTGRTTQDEQEMTAKVVSGAQAGDAPEADAPSVTSHSHLPIGFHNGGLSFGNSSRWNGLRINLRDKEVEEVNGINLTLWTPGDPAIDRFRGLSLGVAPRAARSSGLSIGLLSTLADESLEGLQVAGLATVSEGRLTGLSAAGLAVVAEGDMTGLSVGGLAVVSKGEMTGASIGGLAVVAKGDMDGLHLGGLAVVSEGRQRGIHFAGLALVSKDTKVGINAAGLACVSEGDIQGLSAAGLVTVAEMDFEGLGVSGLATIFGRDLRGIAIAGLVVGDQRAGSWNFTGDGVPNLKYDTSATGIMLAGYRVQANHIQGVAGALLMTRSHEMDGLAFGAYNAVSGLQRGLSVGLFNHAADLQGIQIGLLNHVAENPKWLRWLPLVNARF